ncbi:EAL domain-containing protein [Wenzhouxiangella limi]|uniref:EAL domain-containing protein n=1 Tax=Wenzhouxiangella limi TaxID=2707351 RepID=A0A845V0B4_9GAMM|nr:EAL domain-containing protein [Wenzhouxiangella limi]NDY97057.1 EAL domain-containing protein [Wenzhouxiangella limi]
MPSRTLHFPVWRTAGFIVWCLLLLSATQAQAAEPVRLGILSPRPPAEALARWAPLESALKESLAGREVVIRVFDLDGLEQAVAARRLDFVLTSPGHFVMMQHRHGLSAPLATRISRYQGRDLDAIGGVIIARSDDARIRALEDLSGRRIAVVDPVSMGGYQMQAHELFQAGLPLPEEQNLVQVGTPHDRVIEAVLAGEADAGFLRAGRLEALIRSGEVAPDALRVIHPQSLPDLPFEVSTRLYPEWPLASLPHIDPELSRQVAMAILGLTDRPAFLESVGFGGFRIPVDYRAVEDMLRDLRVPPFDLQPDVSLADLWRAYRLEILVTIASFLLVLGLVAMLGLSRRRLKRLERIIERSPVAAISWRSEEGWPVTYVSENASLLGYEPGRFQSGDLRYDELIHPDDLPRIRAEVERHLAEGPDDYDQKYRFRHGDGRWIWIQDHTWLTRDRHGRVIGIHGVLMDVTDRQKAEEKAEHSRYLLRYIIEHARYAVAVHDRDLNYIYVSENYLDTFNVSERDIIGKHHYEVFPDLPQKLREVHRRVLQGEVLSAEDDPFEYPDGTMDWTRWECRPWFEADGTIGGLIVYTEITTERKQAELALREQTEALARSNERLEQLATVFTHAREGVVITDAAGDIIEVNDAFSRITGYPREEALGRNPRFLRSGRHGPSFYSELWETLARDGYWSGEIWNRRKSGELYPQQMTITAVSDEEGCTVQYVALINDVSALKQHERQIEYATNYDALTGLPNRRLLADRLKRAMAQMQRQDSGLAVIYLDLDGFKDVNEAFGHDIGDRLLCQLADRIQAALRAGDAVARLGGDELVIVLVDVSERAAVESMLENLLESITAPFVIGDNELRLSASLGVTFYPQPEEVDADQLMRQADQAMYRAKLAGKGHYQFFDREEDLATRGLHDSQQRVRRGLEDDEFVLFYQPKVNMRTGEVIGAEALIRWQHPERGLLAPGQFLPLVENHDLALVMGDWVIDRALGQIASWNEQGLALSVSVNVFARQLQQNGFVDSLRAALERFPAVQEGQFEIEVLETSALADMSKVSSIISECQAMGVRCALDDFGTGYSSLSYLKCLPAAVLKIDQSFVRDMLDDPEDLAILNGVLGLASAFDRVPIAEGVETVRHGEILLDLGCDLAQGYGIARPMPAADLPEWIGAWQPSDSWRDRPPKNAVQLRLSFAMVEHRSWVGAVAEFLETGQRPPALETADCAFGRWLRDHADSLQLDDNKLQQLYDLHDQAHSVGRALIAARSNDGEAAGGADAEQLFELRDRLLDCMQAIERSMDTGVSV